MRAKRGPLIHKGYFQRRPYPSGGSETKNAASAGLRSGVADCEALDKALNVDICHLGVRTASLDPVLWIAARANVATSTARVFAELNGFTRCEA